MGHSLLLCVAYLMLCLALPRDVHGQGAWAPAHATFYAYTDPRESLTGACGYDNVLAQGYGTMTTAVSTAFFNNGYVCGACFEIKCDKDPQWCLPGTITVTATNLCPPSDKPNNNGGWCNPPLKHFDLNFPAFQKIAKFKAGIVPVQYRRVPCVKRGGVKFAMKGFKDWITVLVFNVGGAGDVKAVSIKGTRTGWIPMTKNWGQIWQVLYHADLVGQGLSFQVTTSDGRMVEADGVAPPTWQFGQTFQGSKQF